MKRKTKSNEHRMFQVLGFRFHDREGQVMLLAMLVLAGTIIGATTVAGLLITYQIRQSVDFTRSAQAIFTADAGIDWALYQFFKPGGTAIGAPTFPTDISLDLLCYDAATDPPTQLVCTDPAMNLIKSAGIAYGARRIFELSLGP